MVLVYLTFMCEFLFLILLRRKINIKIRALKFSCVIFLLVLIMFFCKILFIFPNNTSLFYLYISKSFYFTLSLDVISLTFLLLTSLLIPLCILYTYNLLIWNYKLFVLLLVSLEFLLFNAFLTYNLIFFYIFFESVLIPMGFIIGIWGSRQRKMHAFFLFFIYTLLGSFLLLVAIMMIFSHLQSMEFFLIKTIEFSFVRQHFIWWCFFLGFAIKIPMFPFHVWLPEAHTEAPTVGSVLLAAVLLKLGSYGMVKFLFLLFIDITIFYIPFVLLICFVGMCYISLTAIRQVDIKKIIAYSSVAHMSYVVAGAVLCTPVSLVGSVYLMLGHGLVSAGLFFGIGFLYERFKTRNIKYYGNIASFCPKLTFVFLILTIANTAFPGTCNFVGEVLVLLPIIGTFHLFEFGLGAVAMIVFNSVYAFWLFNRIFYGENSVIENIVDLNKRESFIANTLLTLIVLLGLFPNIFLSKLSLNVLIFM